MFTQQAFIRLLLYAGAEQLSHAWEGVRWERAGNLFRSVGGQKQSAGAELGLRVPLCFPMGSKGVCITSFAFNMFCFSKIKK